MSRFKDEQIAEIKARIDLIDLISSYGIQVQGNGGGAKCKCPFHNEKTPSFSIDANKGLYYCFGCGEAGDAIKFVMKQEGVDFPTAVKGLAERCGLKLDEELDPRAKARGRIYALMAELSQFYHRCLGTKEGEIARNYLAARNLTKEIQDEYCIGYAPKSISVLMKWAEKYNFTLDELAAAGIVKLSSSGGQPYYYFGGRLIFSICDKGGRVVAFSGRQLVEDKKSGKYVNSPETVVFKKGKTLFGFDKASGKIVKSPNREVIVCEGQIDCIRLQTSGFGNAVASQGTAFTEDHARMLKRVADTATLCFDDDAAGHKATNKTALLLLAEDIPVRVISLPDGDDPDSYIQTKGADGFRSLMEDKTESIIAFQVRTERAKELDPTSLDAVSRVTKTVLGTIARCSSPTLRAHMMKEASRLLEIPKEDIAEEIRNKVVQMDFSKTADGNELADDLKEQLAEQNMVGKDAATAFTDAIETAVLQFIIEHEKDEELKATVKMLVPPYILRSSLLSGFIAHWEEGKNLSQYIEELCTDDYAALLSSYYYTPRYTNDLRPCDEVFYLVRHLWFGYLKRLFLNLVTTKNPASQPLVAELSAIIAKMMKMGRKSMVNFIKAFNPDRFKMPSSAKEESKDNEVQAA